MPSLWPVQYGGHLRPINIFFWCDNQPVVDILNSKCSKEPKIMVLVRELTLVTLHHKFYFKVRYVEGIHNTKADPLSRFQMEKFRQMVPKVDSVPKAIPGHLLLLQSKISRDMLMHPWHCLPFLPILWGRNNFLSFVKIFKFHNFDHSFPLQKRY